MFYEPFRFSCLFVNSIIIYKNKEIVFQFGKK